MFEDWDTLQSQTKNWFFLDSPTKVCITCALYIGFVFFAGPKFMQNRPAYSLKNVLLIYNVFQIIVSFYLAKEFLTNGVSLRHIYKCKLPDYSDSVENLYRAKLMYYTFLLKMVELIETVFFVLRKKQKQISTLHVYHHISTVLITYFSTKFLGCGLGCIILVLNFIVHFFMYTYYLISSFGDESWQRKLIFYKKAITKLQIVQFLIIIVNTILSINSCVDRISMVLFPFLFIDVTLLLYMFVKFYISSYSKKPVDPSITSNATRKVK